MTGHNAGLMTVAATSEGGGDQSDQLKHFKSAALIVRPNL